LSSGSHNGIAGDGPDDKQDCKGNFRNPRHDVQPGAGRFASSPPVKIARFIKFRAPRRRSFCRCSFCVQTNSFVERGLPGQADFNFCGSNQFYGLRELLAVAVGDN